MWQGYLKVIHKKTPHAIHVLDRFHVMQMIGKAINEVRAEEVGVLPGNHPGVGTELKATELKATEWIVTIGRRLFTRIAKRVCFRFSIFGHFSGTSKWIARFCIRFRF